MRSARIRAAAIILAAGEAARFGGAKLAAALYGRPLAQHAIDAACSSRAIACFLIIGANAESLLASVDTRRCAVVVNRRWREGIAASIRAGVAAAAPFDACFFVLADQPRVTTADLNRLIEASERHPTGIAALRAGATWGAPVLFPRRDFAALERLRGDAGAKILAARRKDRLRFVKAQDERAFDDIDTKDDLKRMRGATV